VAVNQVRKPDVIQLGERALEHQDFHGTHLQMSGTGLHEADAGKRAGYGLVSGPAI
jgi:hypothetical protein